MNAADPPADLTAGQPRASQLGLDFGGIPRGRHNAITDVDGVLVGQVTVRDGGAVHSGVSAIVAGDVGPGRPLPAGFYAGNGRGKFIGSTQLVELGELESPIVLTGTLSAFRAADALVSWMLRDPRNATVLSFNPIVGECNDGAVSDIRARPITEHHVLDAIDRASTGPVAEGCVGAGTGTVALGYKAGVGTSSRVVTGSGRPVVLGVFCQANFGGRLRLPGGRSVEVEPAPDRHPAAAGSCILVVATDLALDARQLTRLARRAVFGLARVGSGYGHESGDYAVAFSTCRDDPTTPDRALSPIFEATLDATEEAVINALVAARDTMGHDGVLHRAIALAPTVS